MNTKTLAMIISGVGGYMLGVSSNNILLTIIGMLVLLFGNSLYHAAIKGENAS